MDPSTLSELARQALGAPPVEVTPLTTGHSSSAVYGLSLADGRRAVLKLNARPEQLAGTATHLTRLASLGLPVPRLLDADLHPAPNQPAWVLMSWLPGRDLRHELAAMTGAQMTRLARQLVGFQRRVGGLPEGERFGWVVMGSGGGFASWSELIRRDLKSASTILVAAGLPEAAEGLGRLVGAHAAEFRRVRPRPFLDDLTTKNVLMERGVLSGLVDFDVICYGDRLYWLALTRAAVMIDVGEAGRPYLRTLERALRLTPLQRRRCAAYALIHAAEILGRSGGPGRDLRLSGLAQRISAMRA